MNRSRGTTTLTALVLLALAGAACGTGSDGAAAPESGSGGASTEVERCDPDAPLLAADDDVYRDEPIYVGNEQPTEEVRAWAEQQNGYEDLWLDRDHNGWISVGFSEGAAERQAELEQEFPGVGVVAVDVPFTDAELQALRSDVEATLDGVSSWSSSHSVARGRVEIDVPVLDAETLARFEPFVGTAVCVRGAEPADAVPDGPQPEGGEGWRLLGTDRTGEPFRTGVATDADQYAALWLGGEPPEVDFESEIVIWFGAVYGSSCPIRLDDVVVDPEAGIVHGDFVLPGNPTACTADANPEAYVVSVERDRLPEPPFDVQLDADDPPFGAPEERTTVTVDLRQPGATATAGELD